MMKAAKDGLRGDLGFAFRNVGHGPMDWSVSFEAEILMGAFRVVVLPDELSEQLFQVTFIEDDHVIEQLPPDGSVETFHVRVLPGASIGGSDFLFVVGIQKAPDAEAKDAVVIPKEVARLLTEGHGLTQLLDDPVHGRVGSDGKVAHNAPTVL